MNNTLNISDITIDRLKRGELQKELPEFFELKNFVEKNPWHDNSVFDHTLGVLEELEKLLKSLNGKADSYINQKIDSHTRRELLVLSTLFHDIAKSDTLVDEEGSTFCPKHEEIGSEKVVPILDKFGLSNQEKEIIVRIVRYHDEPHTLANPKNIKSNKKFDEFKSKYPDIFLELILLGMADTIGCQLKDNNPDEFKLRTNYYKNIIDNYK